MESNTTTTAANEKFLQDQVRWVLPEIQTVLKVSEMLAVEDPGNQVKFLENSMKAVYKRLFKVLEATGTKS